jgi:hypothetical protein
VRFDLVGEQGSISYSKRPRTAANHLSHQAFRKECIETYDEHLGIYSKLQVISPSIELIKQEYTVDRAVLFSAGI